MQTDEAPDVVGSLHVDVERNVHGSADRRDLRQREVGRQIEGVCAEVGEHPGGGGVRGREHDGDLRLHVLGQLSCLSHRPEDREEPEVCDQDAADPVRRRPPHVRDSLHHLLLSTRAGRDDGAGY